jgi:putative tryptophan/tyrosine transport system substrate-binding protein
MKRRELVRMALLGWTFMPFVAAAQEARRVPRVGVLAPGHPTRDTLPMKVFDAFRHGLRDLGYVEGRTVLIESRWDGGRPERHAALARELVQAGVDVIVAGTTGSAIAAKATTNLPIVMAATGGDPVALGLAASLSRPGGNVTGLTLQTYELPGKRLELLKEALPSLARVAVFHHLAPAAPAELDGFESAARSLGIRIQRVQVGAPEEFDGAFRDAVRASADAVLMIQSAIYATHRAKLAAVALKYRLPTMSGETGFARDGGLMNYGPNIVESWRRAAAYVDRILKGAKPSDLAIEQPTIFELAINVKTAKTLGLALPRSLLVRADEIFE